MRILEHLINTIRAAAKYNADIQAPPVCILWPDKEKQWEAVIPRLQNELPELCVYGDYAPEKRTGPAIWMRYMLANTSEKNIPIFYLPGIGRQDLNALENCPELLKPLAEMQYRGIIWSQINTRDWTILAFLKSSQGGLNLDVTQDNESKNGMQLSLYKLLDEEVELIKGKRLDKDYFNQLLSGGDPIRDLLLWLDHETAFRKNRGENEWKAFIEVCKSQLAFNPEQEGVLSAAEKLANHNGPWNTVWERFCEAYKHYPGIPAKIKQCKPPLFDLFADEKTAGGWPQWNTAQENDLGKDLKNLKNMPAHEAIKKIQQLEQTHGQRRNLVWTNLGEAPLAQALEHLAIIAGTSADSPAAGTIADLMNGYTVSGWKADYAVIKALALIEKIHDCEAVAAAIRAVYLPWLEASARYLQKIVCNAAYPGGTAHAHKEIKYQDGECICFIDGLRFDMAMRLAEKLETRGYVIDKNITWAALPSITATGKAAVSPVNNAITGTDISTDFEPSIAATGASLKGGYFFRKLLSDNGWQILERSGNGDGRGKAWCETGNIDREGHDKGWKLARDVENLLSEIAERLSNIAEYGNWKKLHIVTDHGWLLMPGGLPGTDLPSFLTESKWGRCAAIKPGAKTDERLYPWYWNPNLHFALADGISCYKNGQEYTHGGLSLQECLLAELVMTNPKNQSIRSAVNIAHITWKGLRCTVVITGNPAALLLDIRIQAGDALSSVVLNRKPINEDGSSSVVVENENLEGHKAYLVLLANDNEIITQEETIIGVNKDA